MGATTHKRWRKARVLDVCEVAQHVRQVVLEPEQLEHPAPPGSHIDIGVYVNGRADVRSYSVVGMGAYGSELILGVQLARQSRGGSAFIHQLRRGQQVQITQPLQNFPLNYGRSGYVLDGMFGDAFETNPRKPKPDCRCQQQIGRGDAAAPPFV